MTTVARHYYIKQVIIIIVCVVFAAWGAYDYLIKFPAQREHVRNWEEYDRLETKLSETGVLTPEERETRTELKAYTDAHARNEKKKPAAYDDFVAWLFMACILLVPWSWWRIRTLSRQTYKLDASGALAFPDGTTWSREEIASIDMSRWMEKSIAWVEHRDGRKHKLDAYFRRNLERIIGEMAHRFDPDRWNRDGTQVKSEAIEPAPEVAESEDGHAHAEETADETEDQPVS